MPDIDRAEEVTPNTPVQRGHPLFLDSSHTASGGWGLYCGFPFDSRWICTRPSGHSGEHAAHTRPGTMVLRWSRSEEQVNCQSCGSRIAVSRFRSMAIYGTCMCEACSRDGRCFCEACCSCNRVPHREQVGTFIGSPSKRFPRYVGVEVECGKLAGATVRGFHNIKAAAEKWGFRIGSDGSIQSFRAGTELSTVPARGKDFEDQVNDLGAALLADEMKANSSCGLHVHIDVRDYEKSHLLSFVYLYSKLEKPLYRLVARSRRTNHYSKAWEESSFSLVNDGRASKEDRYRRLDTVVYGSPTSADSARRSRSKHNSRYHGLNFNSIPVHGTLEFRMHHGTVNPVKIIMWSAVCSAIVEFAFRVPEEEIRAIRAPPTEILEKIIADPDVIAWTRARRLMFANMERKRRGLAPLAKRAKARIAEESHRPRIELPDPGEIEMSEGTSH